VRRGRHRRRRGHLRRRDHIRGRTRVRAKTPRRASMTLGSGAALSGLSLWNPSRIPLDPSVLMAVLAVHLVESRGSQGSTCLASR
jgi:hypothetical protein